MIESAQNKEQKNILLLDFAQETNSGDAAMQMSTIQLVEKYFSGDNIYVSTRFGANQFPEALSQFPNVLKNENISEIIGGLYKTQDSLEIKSTSYKYIKIINLLRSLIFLFLLSFNLPSSFYNLFLSKKFRKSFEIFYKADFVIWNGRNFRGNSFLKEPYKLFTLYFNPLICILLKKPIVCIGASFWEIKNPISVFMTRFIFKRCLFVSVRERYSYNNIIKILGSDIGGKKVFYFPDLSFYILNKYSSEFAHKKDKTEKLIGLTIVGNRELKTKKIKSDYIDSLGKTIGKLQKDGFHFVIIPQVTYAPEKNNEVINEIIEVSMIPKSAIKILSGKMTIKDLLYEYSRLDFLIASRMHSAIFALMVGNPSLSLSYDTGPKWGILEEMGVSKENIIAIDQLSRVDLHDKFLKAWSTKEVLMKNVKKSLTKEFLDSVESHIVYAKKLYDDKYK